MQIKACGSCRCTEGDRWRRNQANTGPGFHTNCRNLLSLSVRLANPGTCSEVRRVSVEQNASYQCANFTALAAAKHNSNEKERPWKVSKIRSEGGGTLELGNIHRVNAVCCEQKVDPRRHIVQFPIAFVVASSFNNRRYDLVEAAGHQ
jgi:hypothetical protein